MALQRGQICMIYIVPSSQTVTVPGPVLVFYFTEYLYESSNNNSYSSNQDYKAITTNSALPVIIFHDSFVVVVARRVH